MPAPNAAAGAGSAMRIMHRIRYVVLCDKRKKAMISTLENEMLQAIRIWRLPSSQRFGNVYIKYSKRDIKRKSEEVGWRVVHT